MSHHGEDRAGTRLPEGVPPVRRPRWLPRLPPGPWRDRRNKLLCIAAALGIGASLWAYWLTYTDVRDRATSEDQVAEACAGIVDAEAAMDLRGGVVRASPGSGDNDELRLDALPGSCQIYRVPGPGKSDGLFSLIVRTSADDAPMNVVGDETWLEPFGHREDREFRPDDVTRRADHAEPRPLGDGALGHYSDDSVTVRADCASGNPASLQVTARADYDDVSDEDRRILAELARGSAAQAASRLKCDSQLSRIPMQLKTPERELRAPKAANASCAWYGRHLDESRRGRLPDRMLEAPTGAMSTTETCLLAASPTSVREIAPHLSGSQREYADRALTHSPWWMRTASFFGAETESVAFEGLDDYEYVKAGTAGGGAGPGVWWASSACDGRPAVHTLTVSYTYDDVVLDRLPALFRAYVEGITERRGCTDVEFPAPSAFEAD
ncbi:hypothetical protein [Streptomyces sp. ISL-98]|uniref:hypothetical protein n=1 Tax=Streptomyces sp. ISL-98 TaxID=2819192 RepID=UPI002035C124|nr:hypothetical protein [Streptomyces sp. ISL-98]